MKCRRINNFQSVFSSFLDANQLCYLSKNFFYFIFTQVKPILFKAAAGDETCVLTCREFREMRSGYIDS